MGTPTKTRERCSGCRTAPHRKAVSDAVVVERVVRKWITTFREASGEGSVTYGFMYDKNFRACGAQCWKLRAPEPASQFPISS